jgi:hypothetical protein
MRERKRTPAKSKRLDKPLALPPVATPLFGVPVTVGSVDANDWLKQLEIRAQDLHWFVELGLGTGDAPLSETWGDGETRLHVYIYPQEWGFLFSHAGSSSWIRIADRAYVHGRDDFGLVSSTPPLREIASFVRELEHRHAIALRRDRVLVRTNLPAIDQCVRDWAALL